MYKKNELDKIIETFVRIINKFSRLDRIAKDFGTGDILYPSEIHMIETIGKNPGINVTNAAGILGITKSAVVKMTRKLEHKKLIKRYKLDTNKKEVLFLLTPKGKIAFKGHNDYHNQFDKEIKAKLHSLKPNEIRFIKTVFMELEKYADDMLKIME